MGWSDGRRNLSGKNLRLSSRKLANHKDIIFSAKCLCLWWEIMWLYHHLSSTGALSQEYAATEWSFPTTIKKCTVNSELKYLRIYLWFSVVPYVSFCPLQCAVNPANLDSLRGLKWDGGEVNWGQLNLNMQACCREQVILPQIEGL